MKRILVLLFALAAITTASGCTTDTADTPGEIHTDDNRAADETQADTQNNIDSEPEAAPEAKKLLTMEDVIALSAKGQELTWADFAQYAYTDVGSGLYIYLYEVDEQFDLMIGGVPTADPMYIRLVLKDDRDTYMDIRTDDVADFIEQVNQSAQCGLTTVLYQEASKYLEQEFHRVFDPYYDIQSLTISNWSEDGNEAAFFYKMTHLYYNKDPDTVDYIKAAKEQDPERYEQLYNDYLALKEANFEFRVVMNGDILELYSNISPNGTEWVLTKIDNYVLGSSDTTDTPEQDESYTLKITRPDLMIYTGPGYDYADIGTLLDIGTYTITEEYTDDEGFTWGKLKSGLGWIDLTRASTETPHILITLELTAPETLAELDCHMHIVEEADYSRWLLLQAYEPLTDIRLTFMDFTEDGFQHGEVLYALDELTTDKPLVIEVVFHGDFTIFGLTLTDAAGVEHQYMIYESGRNGSVVMDKKIA